MKTSFSTLKRGRNLPQWILLLSFFVFTGLAGTQAQVVVNEGFETACPNPANAFFEGCFPSWISTHGSPDNLSQFAGVSPYAGQKYMHGYVRHKGFYCTSSPTRGEGIALNYAFQQGVTYRLTYALQTSGTVHNRRWILTDGLANNFGGSNGCPVGEVVPPIPAGEQTVHSPGNSASWTLHQQDFTPQSNYGQLWFRVWNTGSLGSENMGVYYLDAVSVEILCNPFSGVPAFHFEDKTGAQRDQFCYGEDIYMDGTASQGESQYYIDVWRRPIGSAGAFSWQSTLGWTLNQQVGVINLSEAFAQNNFFFQPGYEYQVKLAIANPPCVPWTEITHVFRLVCCEGFFSPSFGLTYDATPGQPGFLEVHSFATYANIPITHTWTVLASPNQGGGPYTVVNTMTTTGAGPFIVYNQVQPGLYYTVIHKITTACGEMCFGVQRFGEERLNEAGESCGLCGPIDCDLLTTVLCGKDLNVRATYLPWSFSSWSLNWDPIPGVTSYLVQIVFNDSDCCPVTPGSQIGGWISGTSYNFSIPSHIRVNCFSYRVGYFCGGVFYWSDKKCISLVSDFLVDTGGTEQLADVLLYPNPTRDRVTVQFDAPFTGTIRLADLTGRMLLTQSVEAQMQIELATDDLPKGIYWVITQTGTERKMTKLVKQ